MENSFSQKWQEISEGARIADEPSLFVEKGKTPQTQRQLNLFYYFLFIKEILAKMGAKKVLEIGCGRGTLSLYLKEYLGLEVALLDNTPEAIEVAKKAFRDRGLVADFILASAENTNLVSESFDAIISIGLAEHLPSVDKLFQEQFRILKPGGIMISLNVPKKFSAQYLNSIMRFFKKIFGQYQAEIKKDYFRNSFKTKYYKKSAEKAGFQNVSITYVCPFPIYTPIKLSTDKKITSLNKFALKIRKIFQRYPYKTNPLCAQAHFLVGYKK